MIRTAAVLLLIAVAPALAGTAGGYGGYGTGPGLAPAPRVEKAPTVKDGCEPKRYYQRFKGGCSNPASWWPNRGGQ